MSQHALWIGGTDQEDEVQEVDLLKSTMTGAGLEKGSAPEHFQNGGVRLEADRKTFLTGG
jgi:hypothetical protein